MEEHTLGYVEYLIGRGLAGRTVTIYCHAVKRWLIYCAREGIDPLTAAPSTMRAYSEGLPDTPSSRRQHAVALGHWYRSQDLDEGPTGAIRKPRRRGMRWNGIEDEQARAVVQVSRGWYPEGTAALFGLLMGLRRAEIAAVDMAKFKPDLTRYEVHGKGDLIVPVPVHDDLREEVEEWRTAYRWFFPGRGVYPVSPATVGVWIGAVGDKAGVPDLTPHKLRHTFVTAVHDNYNDLRVAQHLARHASPETTAGYTRVNEQRMVEALGVLTYTRLRAVNE